MKKKILSLLLSMTMILALIPTTVISISAEGQEPAGRGETWDILYSEIVAKGSFQAYPDGTRIYFDTLPQQYAFPDEYSIFAYFYTYDYAVDCGYIIGIKDDDYVDTCHEEALEIGDIYELPSTCQDSYGGEGILKSGGYWIFTIDAWGYTGFFGIESSGTGGKLSFATYTNYTETTDDDITFIKNITDEAGLIDLFTNGGYGYLANDIILGNGDLSINCSSNTVNLFLNGKNIDLNEHSISIVKSTTFNLYDNGTTGAIYNGKNTEHGGAFNLTGESGKESVFNMYGGTIKECEGKNGGAINIASYCTFHMYEGLITGNKATQFGGGIFNNADLSFHMHGGKITENYAANKGGGVWNSENISFDGKCIVDDNYAGSENNKREENVFTSKIFNLFYNDQIAVGLTEGSKVGITWNAGKGQITYTYSKIGFDQEKQTEYFFADNPEYKVVYNAGTGTGGYLEIVYIPTLYFGQKATNSIEYSLYTDVSRTTNYYTSFGSTWNVTWNAQYNKPQLNLNNFNSNGSKVQIDCDCIINVTGTNNINSVDDNGLVINKNTIISGNGTLNISSQKEDAMKANATTTIDGATVKCATTNSNKKDIVFGTSGKIKLVSGVIKDKNDKSFYDDNSTLYLAKTTNKTYALYTDYETCNFEYAVEANGAQEVSGLNNYAVINLTAALNKTIVFKQDTLKNYSVVLRVLGNDTKLGGLDASEGTLTVQSANDKKVTVNGDIKTQKLYMVQCNGLTMEIVNGSIVATEKADVVNELMIGSNSDTNKVNLNIKNGGIQFKNGTVSVTNADVNIDKNNTESAAIGIIAHRINLDGSKLTINDVATGIKLYEPTQYGEGAVLTIGNKSTVSINAKEIGVQGTYGMGGNYYNNIAVLDTDSTITVAGETKAVSSTVFQPIPSTKIVRSTDNKAVFFKINQDSNFTTDYYFLGTTNVAKSLTLSDITVLISNAIENGTVTVDDQGASKGETVTATAKANNGYELVEIIAKDKDGSSITVGKDGKFTMPSNSDKFPVTVSASFIKTQTLSFTDSTVTKTYGDASFTQAVNGAKTTVTYSSSNEDVATVNASTGEVTILKAGTTTITASAIKDDTYSSGEATYSLTVNKVQVEVPTAVTGLVYDGTSQLGTSMLFGAPYTLTNHTAINAGDHQATASLKDKDNYEWKLTTPTSQDQKIDYSIAKKDAVVTAQDKTMNLGETVPTFTATVEGLVGSDTVQYNFNTIKPDAQGVYSIVPTGEASQGNYNVNYKQATLTVVKQDSDAKADPSDVTKVLNKYRQDNNYSNKSLDVEVRTSSNVSNTDKNLIETNISSGSKVIFMDAKLYLIIKDGLNTTELDIGDENDQLIAITYKFDFNNKTDIHVLRVHNGEVKEITTTPDKETGEYITLNKEEGIITVYAKKYSTFAFTYKDVETKTDKVVDTNVASNSNALKLISILSLLGIISIVTIKKKH